MVTLVLVDFPLHQMAHCRIWRSISKGRERLVPHFSFEVSDGSTIFCGHDHWCGEVPFKEFFPGLYALAVDRNAFVEDYQEQSPIVLFGHLFVRDRFIADDTL